MFYSNFVHLCNKKGRSPSAIAEEMGFQRSVVTRWSKGTEPRQATLQKIADYFEVSVDELKGKEKSSTPEGAELNEIRQKAWELIQKMDDDTLRRFIAAAEAMLG